MIDSLRDSGAGVLLLAALSILQPLAAQTRERGPWWPSVHGPNDQAGASNYVTPAKILAALTIPKMGQTYELGHPYETSMPQYGSRPYFLNVLTSPGSREPGDRIVHTEYFTGYIGQMGTQFDALAHQGRHVRMADGSVEAVFYNGFTDTELMGSTNGVGGVAALGVEQMKPFITRGVLIDIDVESKNIQIRVFMNSTPRCMPTATRPARSETPRRSLRRSDPARPRACAFPSARRGNRPAPAPLAASGAPAT